MVGSKDGSVSILRRFERIKAHPKHSGGDDGWEQFHKDFELVGSKNASVSILRRFEKIKAHRMYSGGDERWE